MTVIKCKRCGGDLTVLPGEHIAECDYCGTKQTVLEIDNDKKLRLYERANKLRAHCNFDKAESVYESIAQEFPDDAEIYWGIVLCKYGIEYVDDPLTGEKVPTCHRSSFDSIMDDPDFELVMENADSETRALYREEAKEIEELRKGILEVSGKEEPYDIFICYKETGEDGERTLDSVLAQDVYDALTERGYRVFFSRVTLEDKLGTDYEPYIFAALHSARIMLAFGTSFDNYNAVWVKNEWGRFLKLMAQDKKKVLIPCFKNLDAYDIPKEFARFQAQDMGKVGALQDLLRGIDKIMGVKTAPRIEAQQVRPEIADSRATDMVRALLERGKMSLEDRDFRKADEMFEQVLREEPRNGNAYWGKLLVSRQAPNVRELATSYLSDFVKAEVAEKAEGLPSFRELIRKADRDTQYLSDLSDDFIGTHLLFLREETGLDALQTTEKFWRESLRLIQQPNYLIENTNYRRAMQFADEALLSEKQELLKVMQSGMERRIEEQKALVSAGVERAVSVIDGFLKGMKQGLERAAANRQQVAKWWDRERTLEKQLQNLEIQLGKINSVFGKKNRREFVEKQILPLRKEQQRYVTTGTAVTKKQVLFSMIPEMNEYRPFLNIRVGELVEFGHFEGNIICWRVLDIKQVHTGTGDRITALLLAETALSNMYYCSYRETTAWDDTEIRKRLLDERKRLFTRKESNLLNKTFDDEVFLLSSGQVSQYLPHYLWIAENGGSWWLRGMYNKYYAQIVNNTGSIMPVETIAEYGVRPAVWVDLTKAWAFLQ